MPVIIVDSSTVISCAMNCILWVFDELKQRGIRFIVPKGVRKEIIDDGLKSQKYRYEAIRVIRHFTNRTFEEHEKSVRDRAAELLKLANSSFYIKGRQLKILQEADAEVAALAKTIGADAVLTDEKTLRLLIENPKFLREILEKKFHTKIRMDESATKKFQQITKGILVIRSADLVAVAFEQGIFDRIIEHCSAECRNPKREIIEGLLYAVKFAGCAISFKEVEDYIKMLGE